jgi:hypothetical protein
MTKTSICRIIPAVLWLAIPVLAQERWELGASAGYGFYRNLTATNSTGEASVGFKPGVAFSIFGSDQVNGWLAGEAHYTYRQNDAWVSARGSESRFDAESHIFHYDLIFHLARREAAVRPFLAAGGGVKVYRGTGREAAFQPLSNFAVLTRATQIVPVVSVGGGVKVELSRLITLRIEARDFASTFPSEVIAPVPRARVHGWLHDFVPMIGLSFRLRR